MKKITIISLVGNIIFEHNVENNTLLKTLKEALKIGANLSNANLSGADLSNADLSGADLSSANLSGSDTTNTRLPIYSKWDFSIENDSLNIGCKTKTFSEWKKWFEESEEEFSTERNTEDFNRIQAMFYAYEAYYNFLKKQLL